MTVDIDTLYEMLDEEQPIEIQEAALREARKIKSLSVLMQPVEYKSVSYTHLTLPTT